jgi:hypothetical protein
LTARLNGGTVKKHYAIGAILVAALAALALMSTSQAAAQDISRYETSGPESVQVLDFEFFKTHVEPIFLKKRPGHTRCYACHEMGAVLYGRMFRLEKLSPGNTFWTEEQSRRNFELAARLVVPGGPTRSMLLMHPLAPEEGGEIHSGGRQFRSQNDPDWMTLAEWVRGHQSGASSKQ